MNVRQDLQVRKQSTVRIALGLLWTLNFKAMPSALLWSFSLFVSIQTQSFIVRLLAVFICGATSFLGSHLIFRTLAPSSKCSLAATLRNRLNVALIVIPGLIFAITLENVWRYADSGQFVKLLMVSNFMTALIVLFFIQMVVVPIRVESESQLSASETFNRAFKHLRKNRRSVALTLLSLLLGWPLFFFYFLLVLTFAQSMTFAGFETDDGVAVGK